MTENLAVGKLGEDIAVKYLLKEKYKIVERNYRQKFGEIDVVGMAKDRTLVFVEVKTLVRGENSELTPEDNMTDSKITKFKRISEFYAVKNSKLVNEERGWRTDVIAIEIFNMDGGDDPNNYLLRHLTNI